jgi:hypothetical protein
VVWFCQHWSVSERRKRGASLKKVRREEDTDSTTRPCDMRKEKENW